MNREHILESILALQRQGKSVRAISTELGMHPLVEKVVGLKEEADRHVVHSASPEFPGGLTAREVEVLRLVASGNSNSEIANELVLSIRTVERHVSNIYGKTGSGGKANATAFAFTSGLMPFDPPAE